MPALSTPAALPRFRHRWAVVAGLLVLSPIGAEYLIGYGDSIDRPLELLAGLLILAPLYGTVAVLVREITRRTGRGWPTILLLSAAFGVIQAGLIDQTLFDNEVGADAPGWATQALVTLIPGLGVDAASLLNYVGGHVIWSFTAPIAVVESCAPRIADRRWLSPVGVGIMVLLWALSAVLIFNDTAADSTASPTQLIGAAVVAGRRCHWGRMVRQSAAAGDLGRGDGERRRHGRTRLAPAALVAPPGLGPPTRGGRRGQCPRGPRGAVLPGRTARQRR
ncbi:hypothetical protein [Nonomuraea sp. SBT364]|uniref:hypothetical protein n=1 Tax=Nonomuraea sp. SBT364 TaxID=1580530 RepID=UPI00066A6BD2|nr:hypothetical protein [Nonomuraea sp. SBT364]